MADIDVIHEIEKYYNFKLNKVKFDNLSKENIIRDKRNEGTHNYSINENDEVDGICLDLLQMPLPTKLLESLNNIKYLSLRNSFNRKHLSLSSFPKLEILDLSNNKLADISFLSKIIGLTNINLSQNILKDISILSELQNLTSLNLSYNNLNNLDSLKKIPKLISLDLSYNQLDDITFLGELKNIELLNLRETSKRKIKLEDFSELTISKNIKDYSALKYLRKLTSLDLSKIYDINDEDNINDFSFLEDFKDLQELKLDENYLQDVSYLRNLKKLISLSLKKNLINDISFVRELKNLASINLSGNLISDISPLSELSYLSNLNLSNNKIRGFGQFLFIRKIKSLIVTVGNNPFVVENDITLKENNHYNEIVKRLLSFKAPYISILEIEINHELSLLPNGNRYDSAVFYKNEYCYNVNENDDVVELNLKDANLKNLKVLRKLKKVTHLNLGANQIVSIKPLSEMLQLEFLDLSTNHIKDISIVNNFKELRQLYLDNNEIEELPLLELPQLKELWLYSNNISNIENLMFLTNLSSLNISNNKISDIKLLNKFQNIIDLYLNSNLISNISPLQNHVFRNLDLSDNQIIDISPLSNIEINDELNLQQNSIIDISSLYRSIKSNTIYQTRVNENPLKYPPVEVAEKGDSAIVDWFDKSLSIANELIQITIKQKSPVLDLGNCGLTDLSMLPALFECTSITELILSNQYACYNKENEEWDRIDSEKRFYPNNIINIPNEIKKLTKLTKFIVGGDWKENDSWNRFRINDIANLYELTNLQHLNISNNEVIEISDLKKLISLKSLHANNNCIKEIGTLGKFETLEELFISNNRLTSVDFLKDLSNIKSIDLHSNLITDLSPIKAIIDKIDIVDHKWKTDTICVTDNPLVNPPMDYVKRGKEAVINIINENAKGPTFENNDIKLILVGNSEAGKSTLAKYLKDGRVNTKKLPFTLWLDEINTTIAGKSVRILDFGGHDYYHDTHQIFFGNNVVYLLLWETETNKLAYRESLQLNGENKPITNKFQDYPLKYWLESIKFFIKKKEAKISIKVEKKETIDSYKSFVLLIQNKVDRYNKIEFLNNEEDKDKYPFIFDFVNLDIYTKRNLKHFKSLLDEMLLNIPIIKEIYPIDYQIVKESFDYYTGSFVLSFEEFMIYCSNILKKEIDNTQTKGILYYLDNIGVVLICLKSESELLESEIESVFVKTSELSKKFIAIFSELGLKKGIFDASYARSKLGEDPIEILKLMKAYKLIFELRDNDNNVMYIAPLYLPKEPTKLVKIFTNSKAVIPLRRFEYKSFIHKNIILNIFSKYGELGLIDKLNDNSYYWKDGLIIKEPISGQIVLLTFNIGDENCNACIDVSLTKKENYSNEFVEEIISTIRELNNGYEIEEMVTLDGIDFVSLELLEKNVADKKHFFSERRMDEIIRKKDVKQNKSISLKDYRKFLKNGLNMKKIFISYSKFDEDYKEELEDHFITLKDDGLIETFNCKQIDLGENSLEVIQKELEDCDYMIALVSIKYLNTEYIRKFEIAKAKELGKKIIPIIIKPCDWENSIIKDFHASLRGTNISLHKDLFLLDKIKETSDIERQAHWTKIIKEFREKLFKVDSDN